MKVLRAYLDRLRPPWRRLLSANKRKAAYSVEETFQKLDAALRPASVAEIGGFRPPEDRITSWFGGAGVGLEGEALPRYEGKEMFCLLQVKVSELPHRPRELEGIEFLCVFLNREEIPFDQPHGEGWLIREYRSLDGLEPLPPSDEAPMVKNFPIRWTFHEKDAPGWESAWAFADLTPINESPDGSDRFYEKYNQIPQTKFGGFPFEIQHAANMDGFVFQIGSEEKPQWMWGDQGVAYFNRSETGQWTFDCQFY